jgi:cell division cycle 20-like protein 1 (cofactor of APC complex)
MATETSTLPAQKEAPASVNVNYDHHDANTAAMTAATVTKTPKSRLKIHVHEYGHTTPTTTRGQQNMIASTPMSACSTGTSTTASTMTTLASDATSYYSTRPSSSRQGQSLLPNPSSTPTSTAQSPCASIRAPLPSPTRSRLDRQYAKRLATSSLFFQTTPTAKSPVTVSTTSPATTTFPPSFSSSMMSPNNHKIIPSPRSGRDGDPSVLFRPSPIVSIDTMHSSRSGAPGRFFFPSTPSPRQETTSNNNNISFSSNSSSSNSSSHQSATSTSSTSGTTVSSSRRRRNSSFANSMDMGISDRFIPSRATSNMNTTNLWDSMNSSNGSSSRYTSSRPRYYSAEAGGDNAGDSGGAGNADGTNTNSNATTGGTDDSSNTGGGGGGGSVNPATGRVNETSSITTQQNLHNVLLRSELLGENISPYSYAGSSQTQGLSSRQMGSDSSSAPLRDGMNRLRFQSPRQAYRGTIYDGAMGPTSVVNSFSLTPFGTASSQQLMSAPQKHRRKIAKVPFKVLDAPALQDDFYLNLVDWSSQNVLAVGLGSCVYLWSACTSKVTKLCDLAQAEDIVTSVSWAQRGTHLAVGTNKGEVQLWDTIKVKKVRTMAGHTARVGTLAWTGPTLASGSRDRLIFLRDVREKSAFTNRLNAHRQEVCGLKWSYDEPAFLASGGNDNQLHVVDSRNPTQPIHRFTDHTAAVKAIAWSPHQHGLLASGGGTADRCIRFWNTLSGSALNCVDTGSQVCNLAWSQNCNEIVSTHGYSLNQIVVWRYPSLSKVVTLTGHTYRVLYLAMSPDGSTIVTGAGDETLRFWQVFPGPRSDAKNNAGGLLFPNTLGSVIR